MSDDIFEQCLQVRRHILQLLCFLYTEQSKKISDEIKTYNELIEWVHDPDDFVFFSKERKRLNEYKKRIDDYLASISC